VRLKRNVFGLKLPSHNIDKADQKLGPGFKAEPQLILPGALIKMKILCFECINPVDATAELIEVSYT
jgi:hypothetical protein